MILQSLAIAQFYDVNTYRKALGSIISILCSNHEF